MEYKRIYSRMFQCAFGMVNKVVAHRQPQLVCGEGSVMRIPELLKQHGVANPMIVTGARVGRLEAVEALRNVLPSSVLYAEVKSDPLVSQVEQMAELYRGSHCDGIIAIGGGSNMDAAKAMGALIARPKKNLKDLGGLMKVRKEIPFFIAVPTTAGTGSECSVAAIVTDDKVNRKYGVNDMVLCPDVAIADPRLSITLPPKLTAYTGMDALTHAIEAYLNAPYHIKGTREKAVSAVRDIFRYLPQAYNDGQNVAVREKMLLASYNAGIAFTVACVGYVHAIAHTFGGLYGIQHGLANAVILPYVLERYLPKCDEALAELADISGVKAEGGAHDKALAFIAAIRQMNKAMDIPLKFNVLKDEDVDKMAEWANKEANPLYPCPVFMDKNELARIVRIVG